MRYPAFYTSAILWSSVQLYAQSQMDWRDSGMVSPVRDQGQFGTCWAFGQIAAMESVLLKEKGIKVDLSEQNFANSFNFAGFGANGGNMDMADGYVSSLLGPVLETDQPYGDFVTVRKLRARYIFSSMEVLGEGEVVTPDTLKKYLREWGPFVSGVNASSVSGDLFLGGGKRNHVISVVGYQPTGWIIKNSWGIKTGIEGYFRSPYNVAPNILNGLWLKGVLDSSQISDVYSNAQTPYYTATGIGGTGRIGKFVASRILATTDHPVVAVGLHSRFPSQMQVTLYARSLPGTSGGQWKLEAPLLKFDFAMRAGFQMVGLPKAIPLQKGQEMIVVVEYNAPKDRPQQDQALGFAAMDPSMEPRQTLTSTDGVLFEDLYHKMKYVKGGRAWNAPTKIYTHKDGIVPAELPQGESVQIMDISPTRQEQSLWTLRRESNQLLIQSPSAQKVSLRVTDVKGQVVQQIPELHLLEGENRLEWKHNTPVWLRIGTESGNHFSQNLGVAP